MFKCFPKQKSQNPDMKTWNVDKYCVKEFSYLLFEQKKIDDKKQPDLELR